VLAKAVSGGDLSVEFRSTGSDEIGELGAASQQMAEYLTEAAQCAQMLAQGDFSAGFTARSDKDVLGQALVELAQSLRQSTGVLEQIAQGNVNVSVLARADGDQLNVAFVSMIDYLRQRSDDAGRIAAGDLSFDVDVRSSNDAFGMAFAEMVDHLSHRGGRGAAHLRWRSRRVGSCPGRMATNSVSRCGAWLIACVR